MKGLAIGLATGAVVAWASSCTGGESPSAKTELGGQVVFSHEVFEDASKYETAAQYKEEFKVTDVVNMAPPTTSFKYYASFGGPLGASRYYTQVYDTTTGDEKPVVAQVTDVKSPIMSQATGGWTFDIPEWPPPESMEDIMENSVWVKPGHTYRVVILKPVAAGEFSVSAEAPEGELADGNGTEE